MTEIIAWLVLRVVFAGFFLYPIYGFLQDWPSAKQTATLIYPAYPAIQAVLMIVAMVVISISILFGIYGHIGGLIALFYSLLGVAAHYACVHNLAALKISDEASSKDQALFSEAKVLGVVGHSTSAQKNYVIAAVSFFFMLLGTGPFSITS
ncbi:Uncharacterised protein [Legionella lansingensis]|uniref:Uncharacterized protein n=1 Tax=Legionella lansingensis TaxID=45067 RepID=A0A0W0VRS6_9GAMM|nr:hypothetical protein [Legionella lansingensis]KTD22776.1 hypothetical protein Llan_1127 [Legionella lansingensis]SNV57135.1 Uncharacterised protein [Legionella lansingensis]